MKVDHLKTNSFYWALLKLNLRSSIAAGFWLQMFFMILNNVIFWVIWLIFFRTFDNINGWRLQEVTLMYATTQLAWGIKVVFFGGSRNLAQAINDGDLDRFLLQPRNPLVHMAFTRSFASGWGDIISGIALAILSGYLGSGAALVYGVAVIFATATFTAAEVVLHSLTFWLGTSNNLARQLTDYIIMLSCYPQNIYSGWLKLVMYVLIPAAVIGYLPVEFTRGSLHAGALLIGLTCFFVGVAFAVFFRGLNRYVHGVTAP